MRKIILLLIVACSVQAQDVFYTVIAEFDGEKIPLDTIHFQNVTNNTHIDFFDLPDQEDYRINLSARSLEAETGISDNSVSSPFTITQNSRGNVGVIFNGTIHREVYLSIYNLKGQERYAEKLLNRANQQVQISIPNPGLYIVHFCTAQNAFSFKAFGGNTGGSITSTLINGVALNEDVSKNAVVHSLSDFTFQKGDSLHVSIALKDYKAEPIKLKVDQSETLTFILKVPEMHLSDMDGNNYTAVKIGSQWWMAQNLKTSKFADGTPIEYFTGTYERTPITKYKKYFFYYNDDSKFNATYGKLYSWAAVVNGVHDSSKNPSGIQGVCPDGWHLPSDVEWTQLLNHLGGKDVAGGSLKEEGTAHWKSPNVDATNASGFTALPGGYRNFDGKFISLNETGYWWTTSQFNEDNGAYVKIYNRKASVTQIVAYKENGYSVRCVKD